MIVAIDFDGTIVEDQFPDIGKMRIGAKEAINKLYDAGYTIIIWTCRTKIHKARCVEFLARNGIKFHYINESCKTNVMKYGGIDTRKVYADIYVDDKGLLKPLPSWEDIHDMIRDRLPTYADKVAREGYL